VCEEVLGCGGERVPVDPAELGSGATDGHARQGDRVADRANDQQIVFDVVLAVLVAADDLRFVERADRDRVTSGLSFPAPATAVADIATDAATSAAIHARRGIDPQVMVWLLLRVGVGVQPRASRPMVSAPLLPGPILTPWKRSPGWGSSICHNQLAAAAPKGAASASREAHSTICDTCMTG
jgi:hypothetical protein